MSSGMSSSAREVAFLEMKKVDRETLNRFALTSGDPNLIHLDDDVAKKMGLPSVIAHGMLVAAWAAERAVIFARDEGHLASPKILSISTRFQAMTFPGDTISIGGKAEAQSSGGWKLELQAKKQTGEVVITSSVIL